MADLPIALIVVPVRNEAGLTDESLTSASAQDRPMSQAEIPVVDGMSEYGTHQKVEDFVQQSPLVRLLGNPDRTVPIAQTNVLKVARGQWLVRLDAHSTPSQGTVPESEQRKTEGQ